MNWFKLLRADLERQDQLSGIKRKASIVRILMRSFHPRFCPLILIRLSHAAYCAGLPMIPQLLGYANILLFGLDVAPKCSIGPGLFLPHTAGTVIGAWRIGRNAMIFQNVTLGAAALDMGWHVDLRPEIGDDVTLGTGCKILGGIKINNGTVIGANAVVLKSVEPYAVAVGVPARVVSLSLAQSVKQPEEN